MKFPNWFIDNGCEITKPSLDIFFGVYRLSNGDPCRECNCKSTCPAWPKVKASEGGLQMREIDTRARCPKCNSLLNPVKVERRGGKCACGATV